MSWLLKTNAFDARIFWNDNESDQKYFESYFNNFKNVWSHGDWIKIGKNGGVTIFGRSDATLNRGGVRIGTAEIYQVLDGIAEVKDSLVICLDKEDGTAEMPLFVQFAEGFSLTEEFVKKIKTNSGRNLVLDMFLIQFMQFLRFLIHSREKNGDSCKTLDDGL